MKWAIIKLLKKSEQYLSGEEISGVLGVSRTAVWKHINSLKEDGYVIESQTKLGYRLLKAPDRLYPAEIEEYLPAGIGERDICYQEYINSTNLLARELAEVGANHGTVVLAEEQTAGKGRLGRKWHSPFGTGIWMSVILRPRMAPVDAPKITLATAVAIARTVRTETGLAPGIKWPNDIIIAGKKVCGILTEIKADMDCIHYVIVGLGLNVNNLEFPGEIFSVATSLRQQSGQFLNRAKIAAGLIWNLENCFQELIDQGFGALRNEWREYCINIGREVTVTGLNEVIEGRAVDIDQDGLLIVQDQEGRIQKVVAGDVTLRKE